jgi:hypothetical protein
MGKQRLGAGLWAAIMCLILATSVALAREPAKGQRCRKEPSSAAEGDAAATKLRASLKAKDPAFAACYAALRTRSPEASARVTFKLAVLPGRKIGPASVLGATDDAFLDCLERELRTLADLPEVPEARAFTETRSFTPPAAQDCGPKKGAPAKKKGKKG